MKKVLLIGDYCTDIFIYGSCERISPEAPIPILVPSYKSLNAGMAGNVEQNLKSLNNNSFLVQAVYTKKPIAKTRFIEKTSGQQILRVDDKEETCELKLEELKEIINGDFSQFSAVIFSDYNKGFLTEDLIENVSKDCERKNIPTFLDTKKILGHWSKSILYVKINEKEYNIQLQHNCKPELFCKNLIVTLGDKGAKLIGGAFFAGHAVEVSNVSGAGDSFLSAFVVKLLESSNFERAMNFANKAASLAVAKRGVVAINRKELDG